MNDTTPTRAFRQVCISLFTLLSAMLLFSGCGGLIRLGRGNPVPARVCIEGRGEIEDVDDRVEALGGDARYLVWVTRAGAVMRRDRAPDGSTRELGRVEHQDLDPLVAVADDVVLVAPGETAPIFALPIDGGEPRELATARGEVRALLVRGHTLIAVHAEGVDGLDLSSDAPSWTTLVDQRVGSFAATEREIFYADGVGLEQTDTASLVSAFLREGGSTPRRNAEPFDDLEGIVYRMPLSGDAAAEPIYDVQDRLIQHLTVHGDRLWLVTSRPQDEDDRPQLVAIDLARGTTRTRLLGWKRPDRVVALNDSLYLLAEDAVLRIGPDEGPTDVISRPKCSLHHLVRVGDGLATSGLDKRDCAPAALDVRPPAAPVSRLLTRVAEGSVLAASDRFLYVSDASGMIRLPLAGGPRHPVPLPEPWQTSHRFAAENGSLFFSTNSAVWVLVEPLDTGIESLSAESWRQLHSERGEFVAHGEDVWLGTPTALFALPRGDDEGTPRHIIDRPAGMKSFAFDARHFYWVARAEERHADDFIYRVPRASLGRADWSSAETERLAAAPLIGAMVLRDDALYFATRGYERGGGGGGRTLIPDPPDEVVVGTVQRIALPSLSHDELFESDSPWDLAVGERTVAVNEVGQLVGASTRDPEPRSLSCDIAGPHRLGVTFHGGHYYWADENGWVLRMREPRL